MLLKDYWFISLYFRYFAYLAYY